MAQSAVPGNPVMMMAAITRSMIPETSSHDHRSECHASPLARSRRQRRRRFCHERRGANAAFIERHLHGRPETSHFFVAESEAGTPAGFLHLQSTVDFFTGAPNCHISDVAVAPGLDGRGIGSRLLAFADTFAKRRGCRFVTLSVFPANTRARALYERHGYGVELLRMTKPLRDPAR